MVAPFSPPTGIQLWSFCCCQPCWLQQSAFYSLTKALLSPCFLLCHCVLKNLPKVMWVLMARNINLTVIWKDPLQQTRHLFPLFLDRCHNMYAAHVARVMVSPRAVVGTPCEKSWHEWTSVHAPPSVTVPLSCPLKHLFIWPSNQWRIQMKSSHLAALSLVHREMEAEHSLCLAKPLWSSSAHWALHVPGNNLIIWFSTADYSAFTNTLLFREFLIFILIFAFAHRQHFSGWYLLFPLCYV